MKLTTHLQAWVELYLYSPYILSWQEWGPFFICRADLPHYPSSALSYNVKIGSYWSVLQHAWLRSSVDLNNTVCVCVCVCSHGNRVVTNKRPHATQLSSWETHCSQHTWPFPYLSWTLHDLSVRASCQSQAITLHCTRHGPVPYKLKTAQPTSLPWTSEFFSWPNKFPKCYATISFITAFTTFLCCLLSWARWIQPTPSHPAYLRSILKPFKRWIKSDPPFASIGRSSPYCPR